MCQGLMPVLKLADRTCSAIREATRVFWESDGVQGRPTLPTSSLCVPPIALVIANPLIPRQPLEAIQARARQDRTTVNWHLNDFDLAGAGNVAIQADVALVFINADSGEGYITVDGNAGDRKNLTAWHGGDNLVLAVAAQNKNTVVVVHSVGPLILEPWIDHPNVSAVRSSLVMLARM